MTIDESMRALGIFLNEEAAQKLSVYHELLCLWNERMDLTNVPKEEMPARHYADSLIPLFEKPAFFAPGARLIDVGTGAGLPGVPLAIARPDLQVVLLDAQRKRCDFLSEVAQKAGLSNVTVLHLRAEDGGRDYALRETFDLAVARAVAPLNVLLEYLLPFVKVGGRALAWKGPAVLMEMESASVAAKTLGALPPQTTKMPPENTEHLLVHVQKIQKTLSQYPRKSGTPSKNPLGGAVEGAKKKE